MIDLQTCHRLLICALRQDNEGNPHHVAEITPVLVPPYCLATWSDMLVVSQWTIEYLKKWTYLGKSNHPRVPPPALQKIFKLYEQLYLLWNKLRYTLSDASGGYQDWPLMQTKIETPDLLDKK
jgi:hypothetical protein